MNTLSASEKLVDVTWSVASTLLLLVCGPGFMFVSAAYVEPVVLGIANCAPHSKTQQVIEFALLFGGLVIGFAVALGILSVVSRNFISLETHQRWVAQFHQGAAKMPHLNRKLGHLVLRAMSPKSARALQQGIQRDGPASGGSAR